MQCSPAYRGTISYVFRIEPDHNREEGGGGDFNSKIGTKADFIVEYRKDLDFLPGYELDTFTTHRNNEDVSLNSFGEQLIQLCIASKLRVLNGRTRGDLQGHFTYLGYQGYSTVDLVLASENIFQTNLIQYLSVQTFTTFSDHRPILLKILISNLH